MATGPWIGVSTRYRLVWLWFGYPMAWYFSILIYKRRMFEVRLLKAEPKIGVSVEVFY